MDISPLSDAAKQIYSAPVWLLFALAINVFGLCLKAFPPIPNRLIPPLCVIMGAVVFPFIGNVDAIVPPPKHPVVVLVMLGIIFSFIAWALHGLFLKRFEKFLPEGIVGSNSNTTTAKTDSAKSNETTTPKT